MYRSNWLSKLQNTCTVLVVVLLHPRGAVSNYQREKQRKYAKRLYFRVRLYNLLHMSSALQFLSMRM
jgi:hypothetical protein